MQRSFRYCNFRELTFVEQSRGKKLIKKTLKKIFNSGISLKGI